jgi:uncharacterized protein YdeI (YjbR/CyaY-like superfamily)
MEANVDTSRMKRPIHEMPQHVAQALEERGVTDAYNSRPAYQQNDYIWWITHAKREETRQKRLNQMLDELESGGVYMGMKWNADAER